MKLLTPVVFGVWLAMAVTPLWAQAPNESNRVKDEVDAEIINLKIAEVEASTTLDDQSSNTLVDLYRKSLTNLERARIELASADDFSNSGASAPAELATTMSLLQDQRKRGETGSADALQSKPLIELEQSLNREKAGLVNTNIQLSEIRSRLEIESSRPAQARERLNEASKERDALAEEQNSSRPIGESAEMSEARSWYLQSRARLLSAEIRKLDQELLSRPNRMALLEARQELAAMQSKRSGEQVKALEETISQHRSVEAESARQKAIAARQELLGRRPLIQEFAATNVELSELLAQRVIDVNSANDQRDETGQKSLQLEEELRSTRNKLEIAGLSRALGQLLVEQRHGLPDIHSLEKLNKELDQQVGDIALEQIFLGEQRQELLNEADFIKGLTLDMSAEEARDLSPELQGLAASKLELVEKLIEVDAGYLRLLGELDLVPPPTHRNRARIPEFPREKATVGSQHGTHRYHRAGHCSD
jgi:potassium efflux system protein